MADVGAASVVSTPADPAGIIALAYERYAPELTVYVARSFRGRFTPEDVVHDTFTRLIREADADRLPAHVRPWLYRVAHNIAVSDLRRPAAATARSIDETPGTESVTCSAEEESETAMVSLELRMALGALPLDARTALLMVADGYSGREIAQGAEEIVNGVGVSGVVRGGQVLELELDVGDGRFVEQVTQLLAAHELRENGPIERQGLGAPLGQRRVALVHEGRDIRELEGGGERRGPIGIDLDDTQRSAAHAGEQLDQRR